MHVDSVTRRPTRDHIDPRGLGGSNSAANKVVTCGLCNREKGCRTIEQWYFWLVEHDDNRAGHVARFIKDRENAGLRDPEKLRPDEVLDILREVATDAQTAAARAGLEVAVCMVTIHSDHVRSYTSPFDADSVESLAVAHQLREQAKAIRGQVELTTREVAQAAE